jgi:hypothetical protein
MELTMAGTSGQKRPTAKKHDH